MKHRHLLTVLLAFLCINIGLANALSVSDNFVDGVKLHVDGDFGMQRQSADLNSYSSPATPAQEAAR